MRVTVLFHAFHFYSNTNRIMSLQQQLNQQEYQNTQHALLNMWHMDKEVQI